MVGSAEGSADVQGGGLLTIREAADAIGVSVETLRRWSASGRIGTLRTAGGHRRFSLAEVRRISAERHGPAAPRLRPLSPPGKPLTALAGILDQDGRAAAARACEHLYPAGRQGWFASRAGEPHVRAWLRRLGAACALGGYDEAAKAVEELARQAFARGASLLECHSFLELFGAVAVQEVEERAGAGEAAASRRLFAFLRQSLLDGGVAASEALPAEPPGVSLDAFLEQLVSLPDVESALVFAAEAGGMELRLAARAGASQAAVAVGAGSDAAPPAIALGEGVVGRAALERRARVVGEDLSLGGSGAGEAGSHLAVVAPMVEGDRLAGVLWLGIRPGRPTDERELKLVQALAERAAAALSGEGDGGAQAALEHAAGSFHTAWVTS